MGSVMKADKANFNEVINSNKPVLLDFWAEWCGPCRALGPTLEEIANEMGEQVAIYKVNVDENPDLANQFNIKGVPTMIFFKNGQPVNTLVGNQPKSEILKGLKEQL